MSGEARCPVCQREGGPNVPGATCGQCGWPWYLPPRAGPLTADGLKEFDRALQAARRGLEQREAQDFNARMRDIVRTLSPGFPSTVIDVSVAGVTMTTAYLDEVGSPQVRDAGGASWTGLLPRLSASEQARHRELADGDRLGDVAIASLLDDRLPAIPDGPVLVICGPASWRALDAVATALASRSRATMLRLFLARSVAAGEQLAELAARAPLRCRYQLMTATIDRRTGAVGLRLRELFPVGAEPGAEASITLRRIPGDTADTTLAIFAESGGSAAGAGRSAATPFALYSTALPAEPVAKLRAVLDAPGRVRIIELADARPYLGTWEQVRRQIPDRVAAAVAPVDLICAMIWLDGGRGSAAPRPHPGLDPAPCRRRPRRAHAPGRHSDVHRPRVRPRAGEERACSGDPCPVAWGRRPGARLA